MTFFTPDPKARPVLPGAEFSTLVSEWSALAFAPWPRGFGWPDSTTFPFASAATPADAGAAALKAMADAQERMLASWLGLFGATVEGAADVLAEAEGRHVEAPVEPVRPAPIELPPAALKPAAKPSVRAPALKVAKPAASPLKTAAPAAPAPVPTIDAAGAFDDDSVEKVMPRLVEAPEGAPDDLLVIKGIGPKLNQLLHDLGIWHYRQIAGWTPGEIAWVNSKLDFKGRIQRERWVAQARSLTTGKGA